MRQTEWLSRKPRPSKQSERGSGSLAAASFSSYAGRHSFLDATSHTLSTLSVSFFVIFLIVLELFLDTRYFTFETFPNVSYVFQTYKFNLLRITPNHSAYSDFSMRQFIVFVLAIFLASFAQADPLDDAIALFRRQSNNTTTTEDNPPSTTTEIRTSSSIQSTVTEASSTIIVTPSSQSSQQSTVFETSTFTPTNSQGSVTETSESTSAVSTVSSPSFTDVKTSATLQFTTVFTTTSDGSAIVATRTSSTVVPTTTHVDATTLNDNNGGGSSGLSSSTKATIGGVVGGVGGALLLAGLAYTAWRVWGKKKNLHDDDMYDPNHQNQEKLSSSTNTDSTPFRSTLETYHQPGPVNTASNF